MNAEKTKQSFEEVQQIFRSAPFITSLGIELESIEGGVCRTSLRLRADHLQHTGVVHAGVIATIADHTAGGAARSVTARSSYSLTVGFNLNLLRGATGDFLHCHSRVLKAGGTLIVAESEVFAGSDGSEEVLVAKAVVTLAVRSKGEAAPVR